MKISVITVCLNSAKTIERTIRSVRNQKYHDLEYIVIDGESTDGTVEIIKRYEEFISYWTSEKDDGLYDAMNKGLAKSTGEVIAFLNSDDWYEKDTLAKVSEYFKKYHPMVLAGRVNTFQKGKWIKRVGDLENDKENIRMAMIYKQPATFARKEVFNQLGGFCACYKIAADFEWMLRVYDSGMEIMQVEDVFTNFSSTGISNTNTDLTIKEAREIALKALDQCDKYSLQEKEMWKKKISRCYDEQQARADVKKIIRAQKLQDYPELKSEMLDYFMEQSYVIWGIGKIGDDMYRLLAQLGLKVEFFVDRKADNVFLTFHNRNVLAPQKLTHCSKIIVASLEYEEEIANQLDYTGFQEGRDYILYSSIWSVMAEIYEKFYLNIEE